MSLILFSKDDFLIIVQFVRFKREIILSSVEAASKLRINSLTEVREIEL